MLSCLFVLPLFLFAQAWVPHHSRGRGGHSHSRTLLLPDTFSDILTSVQDHASGITFQQLDSIFKGVKESVLSQGTASAADIEALLQSLYEAGTLAFHEVKTSSANVLASAPQFDVTQVPVSTRIGVLASVSILGVLASEKIALKSLNESDLPLKYKKDEIAAFYKRYPGLVRERLGSILYTAYGFMFGLLQDFLFGKLQENQSLRARQARELITQLGPAYIKVGQAVSIRPDICSPEYLLELQRLQDQVPPFSRDEALAILEKEFGIPPSEIFDSLEDFDQPVAAASLGQVYRTRLKPSAVESANGNGRLQQAPGMEVAVKVQRPDMLVKVTLDLYIIRSLLEIGSKINQFRDTCAGLIGIVDNWAGRFVDELDYIQEARNSQRFAKEMAAITTLGDSIIVPRVYLNYTTRLVLTSEWIRGRKIASFDRSSPAGRTAVLKLTSILLNAYLVQLLETGFLHADPHPGNFLVTPDGKLCVLDYGLMTEVSPEQRLALVDYVAHLSAKDYNATLGDLVELGFIPAAIIEDPAKRDIVAPILGSVLEQLSQGGGVGSVSVDQVGREVEQLGREYPIQIPPYFALIARAFGALEGLGLSADPMYSIVQDCFPYLARRLLTDNHPRTRDALKAFLYGRQGRLDVDRVDDLVEGYRVFSQTAELAASGRAFLDPSASVRTWGASDASKMGLQESTRGMMSKAGLNKEMMAGLRNAFIDDVPTAAGFKSQDYTKEFEQAALTVHTHSQGKEIDRATKEAIEILFAKDGNYVQDLILEELVRISDAVTRGAAHEALTAFKSATNFSPAALSRLGPLNIPFAPLIFASKRLEKISKMTDEDREALKTFRRLLQVLAAGQQLAADASYPTYPKTYDAERLVTLETIKSMVMAPSKLSATDVIDVMRNARSVLPFIPAMAPGVRSLARRFAKKLVSKGLMRIAESLED